MVPMRLRAESFGLTWKWSWVVSMARDSIGISQLTASSAISYSKEMLAITSTVMLSPACFTSKRFFVTVRAFSCF